MNEARNTKDPPITAILPACPLCKSPASRGTMLFTISCRSSPWLSLLMCRAIPAVYQERVSAFCRAFQLNREADSTSPHQDPTSVLQRCAFWWLFSLLVAHYHGPPRGACWWCGIGKHPRAGKTGHWRDADGNALGVVKLLPSSRQGVVLGTWGHQI